jgi:tetratricopeptide (TPR) repeat protein
MDWIPRDPALFSRKLAACGLLAACLAAGHTPPLSAQTSVDDHPMGTQDEMPPDKLPIPQKMSGIGNVHIRITATSQAQLWFNQGLNLLHDFWDYESARAFEQSIRVDPQCAMCYWGLYKAEAFFHSTSQHYAGQALATAVSLKDHVSEGERLYIEASAAHEDALKNARQQPNFSEEVKLWRKLVEGNPKDSQAQIFLAEAINDGFDDQGEPRAGEGEGLAIFQSILKDEPENSAANHYYIHELEKSSHPERALPSAEILASLAPTSGHMVHMPGHIFYRIGDYVRAEKAFDASVQADELYMREQHVQPDNDWNYVHNLMYAIANLVEEGKPKEATALSMKLTAARGQLESTLYIYSTRDSISRLDPRLPVALRTGDWGQVTTLLKASTPPAALRNLDFLARQLAAFAAGMQAIEAHDLPKAEDSSARLDAGLWRMSQQLKDTVGTQVMVEKSADGGAPKLQLMPDALPDPLLSSLSVMSLELRGSVLTIKKKSDEAKKLFARAAQKEKALGYREPPAYIRPVGETQGAALMAVGDWAGANAAYKQALLQRPRSGFPLYGIAMSSEQASDSEAATKEYAEFLETWKGADPELIQVRHARNYLEKHQKAAAGR